VVGLWAVEGGRELWWLLARVTQRQQVSWMVVVEENGGGRMFVDDAKSNVGKHRRSMCAWYNGIYSDYCTPL
jgi:uncharacterized protein YodC (DUF2158 family)